MQGQQTALFQVCKPCGGLARPCPQSSADTGGTGKGGFSPENAAQATSPENTNRPSPRAEKASLQELGLELARLPRLERLAAQRCAEVRAGSHGPYAKIARPIC